MLEDYTKHQQGIIKRYYKNQEATLRQRLAELVTELYLSEGKKRIGVWKRIVTAMEKLGLPQTRIDHLVAKDDPALLADLIRELEGKS